MNPLPAYMTIAELAEVTGQAQWTVRRHCAEGRVPGAEKAGRDWVIPIAGAEQYVSTHQRYARRPVVDPPRPAVPEGEGT